jgi:hypothetical protein
LDDNFEVTIQIGSEFIEISADENLISYIEPTVKNGQLEISINKKVVLQPSDKVQMIIGIKNLENLSCSGNTHITSSDTIKSNLLNFEIVGSGNINLIIQTNVSSASISGSGNINLQGTCEELTASVAGSGRIYTQDLVAQTVNARISGSGSATVYAIEFLNVNIAGSGNLMYKGSPQVQEQVGGSGRISRVN